MHAIKAIYDGNSFTPIQPIPVEGSYEVVITFMKPVNKDALSLGEGEKLPRSTIKGLLKGKVKMSKDFNEPIEEMMEYMK
jgi:hypothetical protein